MQVPTAGLVEVLYVERPEDLRAEAVHEDHQVLVRQRMVPVQLRPRAAGALSQELPDDHEDSRARGTDHLLGHPVMEVHRGQVR